MKATARCEAARANGRGYASEKACIEDTHVQSGTDLVGRRTPNSMQPWQEEKRDVKVNDQSHDVDNSRDKRIAHQCRIKPDF